MNQQERTSKRKISDETISRGRHEFQCRICAHALRREIEEAFIARMSQTDRISERYGSQWFDVKVHGRNPMSQNSSTEKTQMIVRKRVAGVVEHNDREFAEVQTVGTEGIEMDLLLGRLQLHREDTTDTPEEFQRRFPVGIWLDISTTIEITPSQIHREKSC